MPVPVVLLIYLLALALIVMSFLPRLRSRELESTTDEEDGQPFCALPVTLAFDPEYAIIWDTQLPAMELISAAGKRGVAKHDLLFRYCKDACRYPELYDGSSFKQWLHFLESAQLIACNQTRVVLTAEGREFLHFRVPAELMVLTR
jgi:hypothetical protein